MASVAERDPRAIIPKECRPACRRQLITCAPTSSKVDEPQLKAMFETAAEVLGGPKKAFSDYESKNESAWRK